MWIVLGTLLGYLLGREIGTVVGFVIGLIVQGQLARRTASESGSTSAGSWSTPSPEGGLARRSLESRLAAVEARLLSMEERLTRLDGIASASEARETERARDTDTGAQAAGFAESAAGMVREVVQAAAPQAASPAAPETVFESAAVPAVEGIESTTVRPASPSAVVAPSAEAREIPVSRPSALSALFTRLISGNVVAKIGAVVLFFGVGFLLKYAYEHALLPPWLRLLGVALGGITLLVVGYRLSPQRRLYALIVQGAGLGLLYIDVFFGLKFYQLLGPEFAFALFTILGAATVWLAVRQDARPLAVMGLFGAFLAPVLASTGAGSHVLLFSYYTALNSIILAVSWFKAWRELNVVGFIFTFAIGGAWGLRSYRPELFATVEPFLLIHFAIYLIIPILFATRQPPRLKGLVDGTLVFGTPIASAAMQAGLTRELPYGLAWSAGIGATLYAVLAFITWRRSEMRLLAQTYVALVVFLATATVFFALDAYPTFALWTLEGAAIVWVSLRQQQPLARIFGLLLQIAAAVLFLAHYDEYRSARPYLNDFVLGCGIIAIAGFLSAWLLQREHESLSAPWRRTCGAATWWAGIWYAVGGLHALAHAQPDEVFPFVALNFTAVSFAAVEWLGARLQWKALRSLTLPHVALMYLFAALLGDQRHPLAEGGAIAWPLSFVVLFWCLHRQRRDGFHTLLGLRYALAWVLMFLLATWEGVWRLDHEQHLWAAPFGLLGIGVAYLRYHLRERNNARAWSASIVVLLWGLAFWFRGATAYLTDTFPGYDYAALLALLAFSFIAFELAGQFLDWKALRRSQVLLLPALLLVAIDQRSESVQPLGALCWLGWPAAVAAFYLTLRRQERDGVTLLTAVQHFAGLYLVIAVLTWELRWHFVASGWAAGWPLAACALLPALAVWLISRLGRSVEWPFNTHFNLYHDRALPPLAAIITAWSVYANFFSAADVVPLVYLPLLNPIDIVQALVLIALLAWENAAPRPGHPWIPRRLLPLLLFIWFNAVLLRTIHHWAGVPYTAEALFDSVLVQAAVSIAWSTIALAMMFTATARGQRFVWKLGAALLAAVVIKLFVVDLSNSGAIITIVSFIAVGGLLLLIGYVAPVPPGDREAAQT